jgi:antitoxin HicB
MRMKPRKKRKKTDHSGSTFDTFLEQEGSRAEVEAVAVKRLLTWQLEKTPQNQQGA